MQLTVHSNPPPPPYHIKYVCNHYVNTFKTLYLNFYTFKSIYFNLPFLLQWRVAYCCCILLNFPKEGSIKSIKCQTLSWLVTEATWQLP